ncbi:putative RING finger protein P8B7.23 [Paramyrothecium foliicola]|nr:putative RING finger protein P8B7.23 [Paramyrothecium foliicola]
MNPSNSSLGKSLSIPSTYTPPSQVGTPTTSFESSRRPSAVGPSHAQPTPRKGQGTRKQHRNQRRPGMGEDTHRSVDDFDSMAELRAVRNPSSRRGQTSITHLLNYSMPRPYQDHTTYARSYRRNPTWGPGSGYHAADKARYVHANYRFVVSPEGTYTKHAADADVHLEWNSVMQVIASAESQQASCPICLSEPVAPRMAKCGHIFCLSCLIRFMNSALDDDAKTGRGARWKKCPICEDTVYLHEVRPVRFYAGQESPLPRVGDDVILRLMARNANSTLALPREGGSDVLNIGNDVPWHFAANVLDYARIMRGTTDYMIGQFDEEIAALLKQEKEDEMMFGQDGEWVQKAIKAISTAKDRLSDLPGGTEPVDLNAAPAKQTSDADFYFYSTPPHLYLSPLDIRILKTKYGAFSSFPSTLLPRVEHISTGHVVDDVLRKRAKYLGHLPQGCVISFLECDWTDTIPASTLDSFREDIERRRRRNRDKAAQEERERLQAEHIEAAAIRSSTGSGSRRIAPLEEEPVPILDSSDFQPLSSQSGTSPPEPRAGFDTLAYMSTSPSTQRTVWGTRAAVAASPVLEATQANPTDDGWLKDDDLLGTAELALQIEAIEEMENGASVQKTGAIGGGGGGGGKKKKKQKITLMSTGGRRGN